MTDLTITRTDTPTKALYEAMRPGMSEPARLTISKLSDQVVIADHTAVPDSARGQGLGGALARRLIDDARAAGQQIVPLCPFVRAYAERHRDELVGVIQW